MELNDDVYTDILGICLTSPKDIPYILAKVKDEYMQGGVYTIIYNAIKELYNDGVDVDIVTVSNKLAQENKLKLVGGRKTINDIALNAPISKNRKSIVNSVLQQSTYRKLITIVDSFNKDIEVTDDYTNTCMEYCGAINKTITGSQENKLDTISSGYDEVIKDISLAKDKGAPGLDTGFPKLNYFTGGLRPGKIYILGGRPSMGKSALAMNISEYVSKYHNVLFVSLEMSRGEYAGRLMLGKAGIDVSAINTGRISESEIARVKDQKAYLDTLHLYIDTKAPCRVSDIELSIINLQATTGSCDLVVVDYIQLLEPPTRTRNRETDVSAMSRELKMLAMKYSVPIIVLSQLSRALEIREDKRPILSDLRESGAIEQDADVVLFVYRDEHYHPDNPASRGTGEVIIRKNRGGVNNATIDMNWRGKEVRFTEAMEVTRY